MEENLEAKIIEVFSSHFGLEKKQVEPSMELQKDLNLSALEIADFISILEDTFHIQIPQEETKRLVTLLDIINCVADHGNFT